MQPGKREIRIQPAPGREALFEALDWVNVLLRDGTLRRCRVEKLRCTEAGVLVVLTAGVTRDAVGLMKHAKVVMADSEMRQRRAEGYVLEDLLGLHAEDSAGQPIGRVVEVLESSAQGAFELERADGRRVMLPAIAQVIESVDLNRGVMLLRDIAPYAVENEN